VFDQVQAFHGLQAGHVDLTILTERERSAQSSASLADRGKEIRRAFESP
jgi:hypothetical protein